MYTPCESWPHEDLSSSVRVFVEGIFVLANVFKRGAMRPRADTRTAAFIAEPRPARRGARTYTCTHTYVNTHTHYDVFRGKRSGVLPVPETAPAGTKKREQRRVESGERARSREQRRTEKERKRQPGQGTRDEEERRGSRQGEGRGEAATTGDGSARDLMGELRAAGPIGDVRNEKKQLEPRREKRRKEDETKGEKERQNMRERERPKNGSKKSN